MNWWMIFTALMIAGGFFLLAMHWPEENSNWDDGDEDGRD